MAFSLGSTPGFPSAASSAAPTFGFGVGNTATTTKGWCGTYPLFLDLYSLPADQQACTYITSMHM